MFVLNFIVTVRTRHLYKGRARRFGCGRCRAKAACVQASADVAFLCWAVPELQLQSAPDGLQQSPSKDDLAIGECPVMSLSELQHLSQLGMGSSGVVNKVQHKSTGDVYALKACKPRFKFISFETVAARVISATYHVMGSEICFGVVCRFGQSIVLHFV